MYCNRISTDFCKGAKKDNVYSSYKLRFGKQLNNTYIMECMERKNNPRDNFIFFFAQKLVFAVLWIHVSSQCMKITQKVTCFTQFFKREQSELSAEGLAPVAEGGVSTSTCKIHNTPKMSLCAKNEEIVMRIIFLFYAFHNVSIIKLLSKS